MPTVLGLDIGSSSVIAGLLRGGRTLAESPRQFFRSRCAGPRVEVDPDDILRALRGAVRALGPAVRTVDWIVPAVMAPAWVALDRRGEALTPIITHQDRRSVAEARELEERIGADRHLRLCGCRPFPGGISSTTWAWYLRHAPGALRRADLVGHLNTFLHRKLTGARVIDPSNASFTGLYDTLGLTGWSPDLCANLGVGPGLLPDVLEADRVGGVVLPEAARALGVRAGTPVLVGLMDGSAGMLRAGARPGQLFNVVGSTDVLALCTEAPRPHPELLTRALGVGRMWLQVSTLAAAGSALYWVRAQMFRDVALPEFQKLVHRLARRGPDAAGGVTFEPYLAGERTRVEQRRGALAGLTLATDREQILSAVIEGLVRASAARLPVLRGTGTEPLPTVAVSGGSDRLDRVMHRDWPGAWTFRPVRDATLRGLAELKRGSVKDS